MKKLSNFLVGGGSFRLHQFRNAMKLSVTLIIIASLPACTVLHSNSPTLGTATYASLGGKAEGVTVTPDGSQLASNDNAAAFKHAATVGGLAYGANVLGSVGKASIKQSGLTDRSGIAAGTDRASIAAGTQRTLSGNATTVELAEIARTKELGLKELDVIPAP
jgi:hypothetical protein